MSGFERIAALGAQFVLLSLLAVGGVNAVAPEIHRQAVEVSHWMTDRQFSELFAVAQAAPGPNVMIATVVGWKVAGLWGALVATLAMVGPSSLIVYVVSGVWRRLEGRPWRAWVQAGFAPVVLGLIGASGLILAKGVDAGWRAMLVTGISAAMTWRTEINPLWWLAAAALLGVTGIV